MRAFKELLLAGTIIAAGFGLSGAAVAADLPLMANGTWGGWVIDHGSIEFGGQVFLDKPGKTAANSAAKFNQYGNRTDPVFLTALDYGIGTTDGSYTAEVLGKIIGTNHHQLQVEVAAPGRMYLDAGWYQVPNLRSNTAQTLFSGTTSLTVDPNVVTALYGALYPKAGTPFAAGNVGSTSAASNSNGIVSGVPSATTVQNGLPYNLNTNPALLNYAGVPGGCLIPTSVSCNAGQKSVQQIINENVHTINVGLQRDRKEINYRWTPSEQWDFRANFSSEHRYGNEEQGFLWSTGTSTPMAAVAAPVDDVTNNASLSAEYSGLSPWGMKWNGMLKYDLSIYTDRYNSFTAENPFGGPGSPVGGLTNCPVTSATAAPNCYGVGQMGTSPSNGSNAVMAQIGMDLPWFKSSRFVSTFQYNKMTQNEAFIPMTINQLGLNGNYAITGGTVALASVPRGSLHGEIDTLLSNNVLTTNFSSTLKNKLSYRYYSNTNNTPAMTLTNWIVNDAAIAAGTGSVGGGSYSPHTTLFSSYKKQNAADELVWSPTGWATIGANSAWEQYRYSQYAANITNEYKEKLFGQFKLGEWGNLRLDDSFSTRRYNSYNWQSFVGNIMLAGVSPTATGFVENPYLRQYNIANRNRNTGNIYLDITTPISGLTVTPTAGYRWDDYPTDKTLLAANNTQLGLTSDHNLNLGLEADWQINSRVSLMGSYTFERIMQNMIGTSTSSTAPASLTMYNSKTSENVHTLMAAATFQIIPDQLVLKLSATHELATDAQVTGPMPGCQAINNAGTGCGIVSPGNPAFPATNTHFDRLDAKLSYKIDNETFLHQFGLSDAFLQLHYQYERNHVTNWQSSGMSPYMYSTLNSSTTAFRDMIFMAGTNPNYNAQAVMASIVFKW